MHALLTNKLSYLLIISGLLLNLQAFGQNIGSLQGKLQSNNGQAVAAAHLQLKGTQQGTTSNENGEFSLEKIAVGKQILVISAVGFQTTEQTVSIEAGKTTTVTWTIQETAQQLDEVVALGYQSANEKPATIGKIAIKPMDLPQSVSVLNRQVLEDQMVVRISDVLMNTNGVYISGATGGYQEEISGRGFAFGSSNTFKNGVRFFNGMMTELSGVEKVEVLKGSAAILFGNVAAGGILNLVTKKPKFNFGGEIDFKVGSFGLIRPSFDVYGGIGKGEKVAYRLNGSYESANSFRNGVSSERYYFNPSLLFNITKKTSLLVEVDYVNDSRTPDFGAGIINYNIVNVPREKFLGVSWSYFKAQQAAATATLTHQFNENWKISAIGAYRYYATDLFANTRPNTGTAITKEGMWIRNLQRSEVDDKYYFGQIDVIGKFKTSFIQHQFLVGGDIDQYYTTTENYNQLARYDTVNVFGTKEYKVRTDIPTLTRNTRTSAPINRVGVYAQDLLSITQYIKLLAGLRYTYQQTNSDVYTYSTPKTTTSVAFDGAFTPRLGLVVQPTKNHAIFASYANSFTLNTGVDVNGKALAPSYIDQIEIGVKNELLKGKLSFNATIYQITNSNLAQISLANGNTNTNIKELAGEVQSKGVEIDIVGRPLSNVSVMAGYSYNETRYTKSNTFVEGSLLRYNPNHTANISAFYHFTSGRLKGVKVGVTSMYFGERYAGRSTRVQVNNDTFRLIALPAYTQIDATVAYTFRKITVRGKIANIFNELSYNVHDDNSVNPIAPTNYQLNFCYKF